MKRLKVLTPLYYALYSHDYSFSAKIYYNKLSENETDLVQCNAIAAASSYMIDNESFDVEEYLKYQLQKQKSGTQSFIIVDDIVKAYEFAQKNTLTKDNILKAHKICAKNVLQVKERGKLRNHETTLKGVKHENIFVPLAANRIEEYFLWYVNDISLLSKRDLRLNLDFYYASYLHIALLHISPFSGLNGVMARLIEKWFLSQKLDSRAWLIPSEQFYHNNKSAYFENIQKMGDEFDKRDYELARDFVLMLPNSLEFNKNEEI